MRKHIYLGALMVMLMMICNEHSTHTTDENNYNVCSLERPLASWCIIVWVVMQLQLEATMSMIIINFVIPDGLV